MPHEIPELITGIPLHVPDANNYFLIDEGGMPNGDDCLIVNGAVNSNYKAFQGAQTLTPNAFKNRSAVFSITFWCKFPTSMAIDAAQPGATIFGVMNSAEDGFFISLDMVWAVYATGTGVVYWCGNDSSDFVLVTGLNDNNWHLITVLNGPGVSRSILVDLASAPVGSGLNTDIDTGPARNSGMYMSLGSYSDAGSADGYGDQYRLGKLTFYNHLLSLAERQDLYNAMMDHSPLCTPVLSEPFDNFTTNSWVVEGSGPAPSIVTGRTGTCAQIPTTFGQAAYTIATLSQSDTITVGFAFRWTDSVTGTRKVCHFYGISSILHNYLQLITSTGVLNFTRGGTVIATSTATGMVVNTWYYIEIQAKVSDTVGFVKVRINGAEVLNTTALDTLVTSGGTSYVKFALGGLLNLTNNQYDDLYISTGAGCTFKGDVVGNTCTPVLTESFDNFTTNGWTNSGGSIVSGRTGTAAEMGTTTTAHFNTSLFPLAARSDYITIGFAWRYTTNDNAVHQILRLNGDGNTINHNRLGYDYNTGLWTFTRGTSNSLPTPGNLVIPINTWCYVELQAKLSDTVGSFTIKVNGTIISSGTGLDTQNGGTVVAYDCIDFANFSGIANTHQFDDLYISTGQGCSFRGDVKIMGDGSSTQILDVPGTPITTGTSYATSGVKVSFGRIGRVLGIRYQREAGPSATLTLRAWRDSDQSLMASTTDTQSAAGTFTVLFTSPVYVYTTDTYTFTYSSDEFNRVPIGTLTAVPNTIDIIFIEFRHLDNNTHLYPTGVGAGVNYFVEPIFEPLTS